ncbi:phosphorylase [Moorena producens]|uniref:phosphorylase n=1 Tax=Moorena producens TaxID=1155739 RepID=UPI003C751B6D
MNLSQLTIPITIILVPQGAEYQAICRGIKQITGRPKPMILSIPMGAELVTKYLETWLQTTTNFPEHSQPKVLLMGLCGSLSRNYSVGDIVVYNDCVAIDRNQDRPKPLVQQCCSQLTSLVHQQLGNKANSVGDSGYDCAPLAPQFWGEQNSQSPPKLGDLGGLSKTKPTRIHTSMGEQNSQSPPKLGDLGGLSKTKPTRIHTSTQQRQANLVRGLSSDRIISSSLEKRQLGQSYQADVVDMEGFATLSVINPKGFAVAMVRVISDDSYYNIPDLTPAISADGSLKPLPLAIGMLKQPIAATRLIRGSLRGLKVLEQLSIRLFS